MSASREKKQRQGGTPSNKTLTAKQQADQTRRKTIEYTVIGAVIAVLVAALLIWNSGVFQRGATAVTVGGTNYSVAEASYFYHSSYAYQLNTNQYYAAYLGYDTSKSPKDQPYGEDGKTYHDYFLESAMEDMSIITALYDAALKDGMSAADVKDDVDATIESRKQDARQNGLSYGQYLKAVYGSYVTPSVFKECVTRSLVASEYQERHKNGLDYTDEQLDAYYGEHKDELDTFEYSYLYFTPAAVETKDADGNDIEMTDEEKKAKEELNLAEAKTKADGAADAIRGGKSVADAISEYEPASSGEDTTSEGSSVSGVYAEWLKDAGRKAGDVTVVENSTYGYYVVVFGGRYLDETVSVNVRHILVAAETSEGASAPTEEQLAAAKAEAEDILARWKAGEATEASFAAMADELSDDGRDESGALAAPGGLYEKVIPGNFVTPFNDWLFENGQHTPGDTGIIDVSTGQRYSGYHVAYFVGENAGDYAWRYGVRDTLSSQDTQTWVEGLKEGYTAEQAGGAKYL